MHLPAFTKNLPSFQRIFYDRIDATRRVSASRNQPRSPNTSCVCACRRRPLMMTCVCIPQTYRTAISALIYQSTMPSNTRTNASETKKFVARTWRNLEKILPLGYLISCLCLLAAKSPLQAVYSFVCICNMCLSLKSIFKL